MLSLRHWAAIHAYLRAPRRGDEYCHGPVSLKWIQDAGIEGLGAWSRPTEKLDSPSMPALVGDIQASPRGRQRETKGEARIEIRFLCHAADLVVGRFDRIAPIERLDGRESFPELRARL